MLQPLLSPPPHPSSFCFLRIKFTNLQAGSQIIASTVYPEPSDTLEENVTIAFSYDKVSLSFQIKN